MEFTINEQGGKVVFSATNLVKFVKKDLWGFTFSQMETKNSFVPDAKAFNCPVEEYRSLSKKEWEYLLYERVNAKNLHGTASVSYCRGLVILPDNFVAPKGIKEFKPGFDENLDDPWPMNFYNELDWSLMESAGAIFLPFAGYLSNDCHYCNQMSGWYWTSDTETINEVDDEGEVYNTMEANVAMVIDLKEISFETIPNPYGQELLCLRPAKDLMVLVSASDPTVRIRLSNEARQHLKTHFDPSQPGSKFFTPNPEVLLQHLLDSHPQAISQANLDPDNRKRVSFKLDKPVGTCNVVPLNQLTSDELATLCRVQRGDKIVRVAISSRTFPTYECQLILTEKNDVITVFPGEMAPPLPMTPDTKDSYWDEHIFINQKLKIKI